MNWQALLVRLTAAVLLAGAIQPLRAVPVALGVDVDLLPESHTTVGQTIPAEGVSSSGFLIAENTGQWPADARFRVYGADCPIWLTEDAIWVTIAAQPSQQTKFQPTGEYGSLEPSGFSEQVYGNEAAPLQETLVNVRLSFPGANPHSRLQPLERVATHMSYFLGDDPDDWRADVPVWAGVRYADLFPGVDLEIRGEGGTLAWRMVDRSQTDGGAPEIRLHADGVDALTVRDGHLLLSTAAGDIALPLIVVDDGFYSSDRIPYVQAGEVYWPIIRRDTQQDEDAIPETVQTIYSTFLGTGAGQGIAVDSSGEVYITGTTWDPGFPITAGVVGSAYRGNGDIYVAELNSLGTDLVFSTFVGGSRSDQGLDLALTATGRPVILGITQSADFPTSDGAFDRTYGGGSSQYGGDAIVFRLNSMGTYLDFSTYLGGSGDECSYIYHCAIATDVRTGLIFVGGVTDSANFPVTVGAYDTSYNGGPYGDSFAAALIGTGTDLNYSTFLGGQEEDSIYGVAVDSSGNFLLTGETTSPDFPVLPGAYDPIFNGRDGFVARLNASGTSLLMSTFVGGGTGLGVEVNQDGKVYVVGATRSATFRTTPGAFDTTYNGNADGFLIRLNSSGSVLEYATFLGTSENDSPRAIDLDMNGTAYVCGDSIRAFYEGWYIPFVARVVTEAGAQGSFDAVLNSSRNDYCFDIVADNSGHGYVTGRTESGDFPTTPGSYDPTYNWLGMNPYISKLRFGYSITGRVADGSGYGIPGVLITGAGGIAAVTDTNGSYRLASVPTGTYTVTPSKSGSTFAPSSLTVTLPPDATNQDFVGTAPDTTPPAAVTNLQIEIEVPSGDVLLTWRAPGDDGQSGGPAASYDLRRNNVPITEANWANSTQVPGEPSPGIPGTYEHLALADLAPHTRWYFALKTTDDAGNISPMSNTPSIVHSGFRMATDAYRFTNGDNGWGAFPVTLDDFSIGDMIRMCGSDVICEETSSTGCIIRPNADKLRTEMVKTLDRGRCFGIASTSLRFFSGVDSHPNAAVTHDLDLEGFVAARMWNGEGYATSVRRHVSFYNFLPVTQPISDIIAAALQRTPIETLNTLRSDLMAGRNAVLLLAGKNQINHAIAPIAVIDGDNEASVVTYDSNRFNTTRLTVQSDGSWSYDGGYSQTDSVFGSLPIQSFSAEPRCDAIESSISPLDSSMRSQLWLTGDASLLITDAQGRRLGYRGDTFYDQIPDGAARLRFGGLGLRIEPIYLLPSLGPYTIEFTGRAAESSQTASLAQFAGGNVLGLDDLQAQAGANHRISLTATGSELTWQPSPASSGSLIWIGTEQDHSYELRVQGLALGANQTVQLSDMPSQGRVRLSHAQAGSSTYQLRLVKASSTGWQEFVHADISIAATDSHYFVYSTWNGLGPLTMQIDHGSNGTIDETISLSNQIRRTYLPVISRR